MVMLGFHGVLSNVLGVLSENQDMWSSFMCFSITLLIFVKYIDSHVMSLVFFNSHMVRMVLPVFL